MGSRVNNSVWSQNDYLFYCITGGYMPPSNYSYGGMEANLAYQSADFQNESVVFERKMESQ